MIVRTEPEGYSVNICACDPCPYIGARKVGTPDRCEVCGYLTPEQWEALRQAALAPVREVMLGVDAINDGGWNPVIAAVLTNIEGRLSEICSSPASTGGDDRG